MKKKNLAFTLAEVLIVIGIIGVVAALTLPNLNHATGDKETVTRLQKAYSILNEANDRAVAIYGPISTWKFNEQCADYFNVCWMKRIGEFLKISKTCEDYDSSLPSYSPENCNLFQESDMVYDGIIYQLNDGISFCVDSSYIDCDGEFDNNKDVCISELMVDINGPTKGKNKGGSDIFRLGVSNSLGIIAIKNDPDDSTIQYCMAEKDAEYCSFWPLEYGNLDYLKADEEGKCNDSNIILNGTTNTSCH